MSWNKRIETSHEEAEAILSRALDLEPLLCAEGLDVFDARGKRARREYSDAELVDGREYLAEHLEEVAACADWVKKQARARSWYTRSTSYGFKHVVERRFKLVDEYLYVSNGAFIAAALGLGWEARRAEGNTPNAYFRFSPRTVRAYQYVVTSKYLAEAKRRVVKDDPIRLCDAGHVERVAARLMMADLGQ